MVQGDVREIKGVQYVPASRLWERDVWNPQRDKLLVDELGVEFVDGDGQMIAEVRVKWLDLWNGGPPSLKFTMFDDAWGAVQSPVGAAFIAMLARMEERVEYLSFIKEMEERLGAIPVPGYKVTREQLNGKGRNT